MTVIELSPSDLTFHWGEYKRCFYLKLVNKFTKSSLPLPANHRTWSAGHMLNPIVI